MITLTAENNDLQVLERIFLRRVEKGDDSAAAICLEEFFHELDNVSSEEIYTGQKVVNKGLNALRLIENISGSFFSRTEQLLWTAIINGWANAEPNSVNELAFITSMSKVKFDDTTKELEKVILQKLRGVFEGNDLYERTKIKRFLQRRELKDPNSIERTVGNMFARHIDVAELGFLAHIHDIIEQRTAHWYILRPDVAQLAKLKVGGVLQFAFDIEHMVHAIQNIFGEPEIVDEHLVKFHRKYLLSREWTDAEIEDHLQDCLQKIFEQISDWRSRNKVRSYFKVEFEIKEINRSKIYIFREP